MKKIYIFDTSTLITDPCAWKAFPDSDVIIPIAVLNELDKVKKHAGEAGRNARVCIRALDTLSEKLDITTGVLTDNNVTVKIDATHRDLSLQEYAGFGDPTYGDTQILACAYDINIENFDEDVFFVSNDINLRIKAKSRGIDSIAHDSDKQSPNELYNGAVSIVDADAGEDLLKDGTINPMFYGIDKLNLNQCVQFTDDEGNQIALGRQVAADKIKMLKKAFPWNISAKNKEQSYAIDLMMDPKIDLVTLIGSAGTGKTLITLAAALDLVLNKKEYEKLVIYRPIQSVGEGIGYTPGTIEEKLEPWFQAIYDNLEVLFSTKNNGDWRRNFEMYQTKGKIELGAITYIRGRSIPNALILLDEAQNLSKEEVKTILTRVGENTKIILTGDIEQIDNQSLDATDNGLSHVIDKFKHSPIAGHITFTQGERSRLATEAARIL